MPPVSADKGWEQALAGKQAPQRLPVGAGRELADWKEPGCFAP